MNGSLRASLRPLVGGLVAGLCLAPHALAAQDLTPEQVGAAFGATGFEVDAPVAWTWTSPPHTTLRVHDRATGRVVMALVYADATAAAAEQLKAQTRAGTEPGVDDVTGPPLVPGYGPSSWRHNVALVQAHQPDLDRWYARESTRAIGMPATPNLAQVTSAPTSMSPVAADFLTALDSSLVVALPSR